MKFGGTSVGSVNSILSVKRIVEAVDEPVIVVVSALGGITDKLINTSRMAAAGDASYENEFREIVYRHVEMIKEVIPAGAGAFAKWLFRGVFTWRSFAQMLGTVAIGGMAAVSVLYFIPVLSAAPEAVQWAIAGIIGSVAGTITERIETVHFSAKAAGMEFESNGDEHK